ncbi:hypothetical protein KGD82_16825 [Nocardiopsis eucommiae]|uniref:Transmembrane protein n=1 Tax=Nocardiopsis eucommiae TaxID=2831970 RepID=A0A975QJF3_9ACTN|nr:hypothetical protein KGD82_16825 [Nocardiopsis eucommiae]
MPRSHPQLPDVRIIDPSSVPVIDSVQAVTGGDAPYCRRCGGPDTIAPTVLAGLIDHIPDHVCEVEVPVEPRFIVGALASPSSRSHAVSSSNSAPSGGIGCTGLLAVLLTVLFVGLKLTGHVAWSWWWVLSPLWISALLGFAAVAVFLTVLAVIAIVTR